MALGNSGFDFDVMARLACEDPAGFERMRTALIEDFIRSARPTADLANLQQRLDAEGFAADIAIPLVEGLSRLMWRSFGRLSHEVERLIAVAR